MAEIGYERIVCDPKKCMGCRLCEYACSATKTGAFDPSRSRIRVVRIEPVTMTAIACRLCEDAACIHGCPRDALTRSEENGVILVDEDECHGCGWCVEVCKFGAIVLNPTTKNAEICDLCPDEEEPPCVAICPKNALSLSTPETLSQKMRRDAAAHLFEVLLEE